MVKPTYRLHIGARVNAALLTYLLTDQSCCELVGLDVLLSNVKYRFILLYRPPNTSFKTGELQYATKSLSTLLYNLTHNHATSVFLGDFNLPCIDWNSNSTMTNDFVHNCLFYCFSNLGLTQFVLEPTRINFNGVSNILDIILCNDPLTININSVTEPIGTSDHSIVNFSVFVPPSDNSHVTLSDNVIHNSNQLLPSITMLPVFNWSAGDFDAINHELNSIDWHLLFGFHFTADAL